MFLTAKFLCIFLMILKVWNSQLICFLSRLMILPWSCFCLPESELIQLLLFSIDFPPQAEICKCGWMRACTWRMPCQSWERAVCSSKTEHRGFFSPSDCEPPLRSGWVWVSPAACLWEHFSAQWCASVCAHILGGTVCCYKYTFLCVYIPCTGRFLLHHTFFLGDHRVHTFCLSPYVSYKHTSFYATWQQLWVYGGACSIVHAGMSAYVCIM